MKTSQYFGLMGAIMKPSTTEEKILRIATIAMAIGMIIGLSHINKDHQQITRLTADLTHAEAKLRNIDKALSTKGVQVLPTGSDISAMQNAVMWAPFGPTIWFSKKTQQSIFLIANDIGRLLMKKDHKLVCPRKSMCNDLFLGNGEDGDEFLIDDYSKLPDDTKAIKRAERAADNPKRDFIAACRAHSMVALFIGPKGKEDHGWCAKKITPEVVPLKQAERAAACIKVGQCLMHHGASGVSCGVADRIDIQVGLLSVADFGECTRGIYGLHAQLSGRLLDLKSVPTGNKEIGK